MVVSKSVLYCVHRETQSNVTIGRCRDGRTKLTIPMCSSFFIKLICKKPDLLDQPRRFWKGIYFLQVHRQNITITRPQKLIKQIREHRHTLSSRFILHAKIQSAQLKTNHFETSPSCSSKPTYMIKTRQRRKPINRPDLTNPTIQSVKQRPHTSPHTTHVTS